MPQTESLGRFARGGEFLEPVILGDFGDFDSTSLGDEFVGTKSAASCRCDALRGNLARVSANFP
jgi:hypothetical protein